MKKLVFAVILCLGVMTASAQKTPHALGVHLGGNLEIEYQYHFGNRNFIDATVGVFGWSHGVYGSAIYDWNIKTWTDWTPNTMDWKLYGGVGASLGYMSWKENKGFYLGAVGNIGFGFTLHSCPLTIAADLRPTFGGVIGGEHSGFSSANIWNFGLSVVYRF